MQVSKSNKLANVCYDIRGPVLKHAKRLEEEGHRILKLNIGNPAPFGFEAPEEILQDVIRNLPTAQGYSDSKGLFSARKAVMQYYQQKQVEGVGIEDIYLGNGVSSHVLCLTFNGLSKSYRVAGFRSGWVAISGPKQRAQSYIEGLDILANMRLCANVPAQHAIQTALGGYQSINDLVLPPGRLLEQRNRAWELLNDIPGVSCVKPMGALYAFPRIDPKVCPIHNDEKFVLDLLLSEKLLIVQGTAFNWPWPDHFRVVTLPRVDDLEQAILRIGSFLKGYQQ